MFLKSSEMHNIDLYMLIYSLFYLEIEVYYIVVIKIDKRNAKS